MEAMAVCGVTSFLSDLPCRCCEVRREQLWDITAIEDTDYRDSEYVKTLLVEAFPSFCRKMRKEETDDDAETLNKLKQLSLYPVENSLFLFDSPYELFSGFFYATADLLHTLLSGLFRD